MKVPRIVQESQQFQFPMKITGYLINVELHRDERLKGIVFNDAKGRFDDGTLISTSRVIDIRIDLPRHVASTVTGGHYVICNYFVTAPGVSTSIDFSNSPTLH